MKVPPRSKGSLKVRAEKSYIVKEVVLPVQSFIHTAGISGYVLVITSVIAILWANSSYSEYYFSLLEAKFSMSISTLIDAYLECLIDI